MAVKKLSLSQLLHSVVVILWVVISVIVYGTMCIAIWPFNPRISRKLALWWNRHFLQIAGIKVKAQGIEKLNPDKQYIFIANHQSHIDIPVLIATIPHHLSFIAKKELFAIPFFGWGIYVLGHIWIDRSNARKAHSSIGRALNRLKKDNISLVLFPEGTRSTDGSVGRFKQGSFALALQGGVELVPVAIHNTFKLLPKHSKIIRRGTVNISICDPVPIKGSTTKAELSEYIGQIIRKTVMESNQ